MSLKPSETTIFLSPFDTSILISYVPLHFVSVMSLYTFLNHPLLPHFGSYILYILCFFTLSETNPLFTTLRHSYSASYVPYTFLNHPLLSPFDTFILISYVLLHFPMSAPFGRLYFVCYVPSNFSKPLSLPTACSSTPSIYKISASHTQRH